MTWNKDRKQTKSGHKRREHMTHTIEPWHNSPLPEGLSHAVTVPPGRRGGRSGGPSGQTRTGTQDGDLQSGTDRQGPWRSWELWKPWRCRELRWPWRSWELRRPWRSWELWRPWRCRELRRPWQMDFGALASVLAVLWTGSTGLGFAAASGHESAPIRWAWVSGDPAGMSQRRSGGHESAAIRWRDLPRTARGNPGTSWRAWESHRRRRAWGHRGHWTRGTRGDPAELPRPLAVGYGGITSGDFLATGQTGNRNKIKTFKTKKQNKVKGRRLRLGLVFCHGAHTREEQEHADKDINSNNSL